MYKCYDLEVLPEKFMCFGPEFDKVVESFKASIEKQKDLVRNSLYDFYLSNGDLDASALQEAWFPNYENNHIFLSHSHKDTELAYKIGALLKYITNIEVFIDSNVWGYADDLLKELDNKYAYSEETNTYSYEVRNRTTSNIYLILQSSLSKMIDSSECLIFLNTENTVHEIKKNESIELRTSSPWIMSELQFSSMVRRQQSPNAKRNEDLSILNNSIIQKSTVGMGLQISHKLPTEHLVKIDYLDFMMWLLDASTDNSKGYDALTVLYKKHG